MILLLQMVTQTLAGVSRTDNCNQVFISSYYNTDRYLHGMSSVGKLSV